MQVFTFKTVINCFTFSVDKLHRCCGTGSKLFRNSAMFIEWSEYFISELLLFSVIPLSERCEGEGTEYHYVGRLKRQDYVLNNLL